MKTQMTTREDFEAWFLAYRQSTWRPFKADPRKDMPAHWNVNCEMDCWRGWQAATLAERERCALVCELLQETALATQTGPADDLSNVMVRQVAYLGSGECAEAIRLGGDT